MPRRKPKKTRRRKRSIPKVDLRHARRFRPKRMAKEMMASLYRQIMQ